MSWIGNSYKACRQNYFDICDDVKKNIEISDELKEALLLELRSCQVSISFTDKDEIIRIIKECIKQDSTIPLRREFRNKT